MTLKSCWNQHHIWMVGFCLATSYKSTLTVFTCPPYAINRYVHNSTSKNLHKLQTIMYAVDMFQPKVIL